MMKFSPEFKLLMIMFMLMITIIFITMNLHPLMMVTLLVLYNIMICLLMSNWTQNFIYSIMLFLIMISGLLIIFLYFSSLISNEQINFNFKPLILINLILNMILTSFFYKMNPNYPSIHMTMENIQLNYLNMNLFQNIMYIYSYPFNNLTLICMFYLLITLFLIIKICSIKNSSLRKLK